MEEVCDNYAVIRRHVLPIRQTDGSYLTLARDHPDLSTVAGFSEFNGYKFNICLDKSGTK